MKTYIADEYQVTLNDDGGFEVLLTGFPREHIIYNPNKKRPWAYTILSHYEEAETLIGLRLDTYSLRDLHEALEVIGKQDLMDVEIIKECL